MLRPSEPQRRQPPLRQGPRPRGRPKRQKPKLLRRRQERRQPKWPRLPEQRHSRRTQAHKRPHRKRNWKLERRNLQQKKHNLPPRLQKRRLNWQTPLIRPKHDLRLMQLRLKQNGKLLRLVPQPGKPKKTLTELKLSRELKSQGSQPRKPRLSLQLLRRKTLQ